MIPYTIMKSNVMRYVLIHIMVMILLIIVKYVIFDVEHAMGQIKINVLIANPIK